MMAVLAGMMQLVVVGAARNHTGPDSLGQLSGVVCKNAYCHHFALHWPYVSPYGWESIAKTPGFISSANTSGADIISAINTITTAMQLRQYFTLTFITTYFLFVEGRLETSRPHSCRLIRTTQIHKMARAKVVTSERKLRIEDCLLNLKGCYPVVLDLTQQVQYRRGRLMPGCELVRKRL